VVEADGGSRGNPGPAGYGTVVKDAESGQVLAEIAEAIGVATNNVAEYRGLLAGLTAAAELDPNATIDVRLDSKLLVEQMSGRWQIKHDDMRQLAAQVRAAVPPSRVRYTWVPRSQNAHADRLANEAMDAAARGRPWRRRTGTDQATDRTADHASHGGAPPPVNPPDQANPADHASQGEVALAALGPRASVPARSSEPTTLLFARHGRTTETERGAFAGRDGADLPLSPAGEADAARLAAAVRRLGTAGTPVPGLGPVDAVVASPLLRAQGTAKAVAEHLGLDVLTDDGWSEVAFGAWDGLTYAEIARRDPGRLSAWYGDPGVSPPGGESYDTLAVCVASARDHLVRSRPGGSVLVVTHGGPVRIVVRQALDAGPATLWRLRVTPCALTAVRYWADGGVEVVTVNADSQLDG
jgi:ribonuclease H / adenosylcobalamin/alpha-ribazole phosphatase